MDDPDHWPERLSIAGFTYQRQRSTWRPEPHHSPGAAMEVTIAVCSLLGWILSTLLAISFTKVARSA